MTDSHVRICSVVGARPQFIKASVVSRALSAIGIEEDLVHTGQHYDRTMSDVFLDELELPEVSVNLEVGSASHAVQTGSIMVRLEQYLSESGAHSMLLVYGDTNTTLAAALAGAKLQIPVAHVEAGLRSFNRAMPEEINRIITDRLSDLLLCPSETAVSNLTAEGITQGVVNTGDVMYDALLRYLPKASRAYPLEQIIPYGTGEYYLATVHRPENTDNVSRLARIVATFGALDKPVVWPIHPRTAGQLSELNIETPDRVRTLSPLGYFGILSLLDGAAALLTDSGGLQKEAFWLCKKCVTLRSETEWVETIESGWNVLANSDLANTQQLLDRPAPAGLSAPYGQGDSAVRVANALKSFQTSRPRRD